MALPYEVHHVNITEGEQKKPAYLKINPNPRIPAIVDRGNEGFVVFESGAILIYLAEKTGKFLARDPKLRSSTLQWLIFQMGGVGPMMGQAFTFLNYFPEHLPSVISRYWNESRRLLGVLDTRLAEARYLGGPEYSIADMATWPWVRAARHIGLALDDLPALSRWIDAVGERAAVQRAARSACL